MYLYRYNLQQPNTCFYRRFNFGLFSGHTPELPHQPKMCLLRIGPQCNLPSASCYPQNVWSVSTNGIPLEAQLENAANGTYHGYPMPEDDAFRDIVISKWEATHE